MINRKHIVKISYVVDLDRKNSPTCSLWYNFNKPVVCIDLGHKVFSKEFFAFPKDCLICRAEIFTETQMTHVDGVQAIAMFHGEFSNFPVCEPNDSWCTTLTRPFLQTVAAHDIIGR